MATQNSGQLRQALLALIGRHHEMVANAKEVLSQERLQISRLTAGLQEAGRKRQARPSLESGDVNEIRRGLDLDRQALDQQREELKRSQFEIEEMARQTVLELSNDRAQIARDHTELLRLREEIRQQLERGERNSGVEERLAAVQRLQQELAARHRPADPSTPTPRPTPRGNGSGARLRKLLG